MENDKMTAQDGDVKKNARCVFLAQWNSRCRLGEYNESYLFYLWAEADSNISLILQNTSGQLCTKQQKWNINSTINSL